MPLKGKDRVIEDLEDHADRLVRAFTLEATSRVVLKTPVDKGRARGNWNVGRGKPDARADESRLDKNGGATIQRAKAQLPRLGAGDTVYVTNSLPYVPSLEDGHSGQAPKGMVKVTVQELKSLWGQIIRTVRNGGGGE